jgi:hypothetical protein
MPTCRPGSSVLDGLQPGRQAQHGESGQDTSTSPLVVSNRFAALDTSDSGLGPQAITQVPEQVLVPATVPSQTHTDSLVPCTTQTVHRGTVNVGTWNVRGKVQKHVHKPVDVSLTLTSKDITVCAIKRPGWTRNRHRHDSGFSYVGLGN